MNAKELRALLAECNLSQRGAAKMLGINERTMRRYVLGEMPVPRLVELALRGHQHPCPPQPARKQPPARKPRKG